MESLNIYTISMYYTWSNSGFTHTNPRRSKIVGFLDWQCVDVSAHANAVFSNAALQHTHYARSPDTGMHVEAEFRQQSGNLVGRTLFLETKLRMFVNIMAPDFHIPVKMLALTHCI